jgi:3-methyladenine DNA glycosylase AlkD
LTSDITKRARAFVDAKLPQARGLGTSLVELIDDPESFAEVLRGGLEELADPEYAAEQERVAPGFGAVIGVRLPLIHAVARQLRKPLMEASSSSSIWLAQRLVTSDVREVRLFAAVPLERALTDDPERSWQLLRRLARAATDWISVDTIADLVARGIVYEPYRWAELEQLVYSESPWERRLVGSAVARMPFQVPATRRTTLDAKRGLMLIKSLIGDADPNVQKALSWALREWTRVDAARVTAFLREEADLAVRTDDGHRAWVIRDALAGQPTSVAAGLRARLEGVRRRADAPSTSTASAEAQGFQGAIAETDETIARQGDRMAGVAR